MATPKIYQVANLQSSLTAAHDQANTARGQANSAYNQANLAFAAANNSNLTLGGTITGTLNVSQDIVIGGNVYLEGNTTYINVATYTVEDSLIYLASNNNINDIVDIGFMGGKNTSGTYSHTGLARDASDGKWKLFDGLPEEGHVGNVINFNNTYLATLVANVEANTLSVINGVSGNVNFDSGTLFVDSVNNRVGVGMTNPSHRLDVSGNVNISQGSYVRKEFLDNTEEFLIRGENAGWLPFISYTPSTGTSSRGFKFGTWDNVGFRNDWVTFWNGNVGIGTTDPGYKLDVIGTGTTVARFRASSGTDALVRIIGGDYGTERRSRIFLGETDVFGMTVEYDGVDNIGYIGMNSNIDPTGAYSKRIQMSRDNTEVAFMAGNVGIGTTNPGSTLEVNGNIWTSGNSNYVLFGRLAATNPYIQGDVAGQKLYIGVNNGPAITIDSVRNVGIGTASPSYTLDLLSSTSGYVSRFKSSGNYGGILLDAGSSGSVGGGYVGVGKNGTRYGIFGVSGAWIGDTSTDAALASDSGNLRFFTNGSVTESMRISTGGNVGIGTVNPYSRLTISKNGINEGAVSFDDENNNAHLTLNGADARVRMQLGTYNNGGYGSWIQSSYDNNASGTGSSGTEPLALNPQGGNVGIGTANPAYKLDVNGASIFRDTLNFGSGGFISWTNGYSDGTSQTFQSPTSGSLAFITNSALAMFIKSNQNVGIGTTNPQSKLEVATSSGNFSHFGATSTTNGEFTGITLGYRENNSNYRKAAIVQEQIGDNSARGHLHLLVDIANDGGSVVLGDSKLMIHGTTGNVGIGTTSPGSYKLYVQGDQYISGTLTEGSSISLKENIDPITNALDIIAQLTGVTYDRKDGSAKKRAGLIAEQVNEVLPNVVQKDKDGNPSGIQYTNLIAYLVESIKELKAEIDILKSK